jgi:hypothetical protein
MLAIVSRSALAAVALSLPALGATPIKVFLLAGQSNMSGWTSSSGMPAAYAQSQANVLIYADGEIDAAKKKKWMNNGPDFGHAAGWFGPELAFGKTLSDSLPGTKIALIKHSVGSTYLATHWRPPSSGGTVGQLFTAMLATVKSGLASLDPQYTPEWSGMLWMQGEFDGGNQGYANEYQTNLSNFVKDMRAQLNVPQLPFLIGMIDSSRSWPYNGTVRAAERYVAKNVANVGILDTYGFATDGTHYKLEGMLALGKGFATVWLSKFRVPVALGRPGASAGTPSPAPAFRRIAGRYYLCPSGCFAADGKAAPRGAAAR